MDDDVDSPFAHVPSPRAGPSPLQDGPLTYERMVRSVGRRNPEVPRWQRWCLGLLIGAIAVFGVVLVISSVTA